MINTDQNAFDHPPKVISNPDLRVQAEAIMENRMVAMQDDELSLPPPPAVTEKLVHELRVHQIELEMQNEEMRRTQVELEISRASYFDLYDLAPVGYCTVGAQGLILQANLAATSLLGVARSALLNQPISKFILKADQDFYYLTRLKLLENRQPKVCELRMVKPDGTLFWAFLAITVVDGDIGDNSAPALRMVITDITESKLTAAAMQESAACYRTLSEVLEAKNTELATAQSVAEHANRAKSDFLSNMTHELRTPLGAILGFAQLLESGSPQLAPKQIENTQQIIKAGWYLLDLINEILDLAQIESGHLSLTMAAIEVTAIINECLSMIEPQAQMSGVTTTFAASARPLYLYADRKHVKQVIINLLSNAVKYNKRGGSVVVGILEHPADNRARIYVTDTGKGLSPEKITDLFQPFNRLGQESGSVGGTGIGLAVCKQLVELMGGNIGVESTVGAGCTFWIELILTETRHAGAPLIAGKTATAEHTHPATEAFTVLYVEDDLANLTFVEQLLARQPNISLLVAGNGMRGFEIARSAKPDVILMDINMPGINGFDAMKLLRDDPLTARIPVLALSANATPGDISKGIQSGFTRYLTKPIKVETFMNELSVALSLSKATPACTATKEHAS